MIDKPMIEIGFKRSGVGAGELDYTIYPERIKRLSKADLDDLSCVLSLCVRSVQGYIHETKTGQPKRWLFGAGYVKKVLKKPSRHYFWPIGLGRKSYDPTTWLDAHGWRQGDKFGWTLHVGKTIIMFGPRDRPKHKSSKESVQRFKTELRTLLGEAGGTLERP